MTGRLTMSGSSIAMTGAAGTFTTASSANASAVFAQEGTFNKVTASTFIAVGSIFNVGTTSIQATSAIFGGQILTIGTATIAGNAFSVGGSTFVVVGGSVAIGFTAPTAPFHIRASGINDGIGKQLLIIENSHGTSNDIFGIQFNNTGFAGTAGIFSELNAGGGSSNMYLRTNGANVVRINNASQVGINKDASGSDLDVNGSAAFRSNVLIVGTATVEGNAFSVGTSTLVVLNGRVGIGITSPVANLSITTIAAAGMVRIMKLSHGTPNTDGNGVFIEFAASATDTFGAQIGGIRESAGGLGGLTIRTGAAAQTERVRVANNGFVGLGVSSPSTTLEVNGNAQFGSGANKSTFSTTGNLDIKYGVTATTAVFTSTASVLGNAFSVGGSSFTVVGGSATVAYRIMAGSFAGDGSAITGISAAQTSNTASTFTATAAALLLGGPNNGVQLSSQAAGLLVSSITTTVTGSSTFSITSSSGINVVNGGIVQISTGGFIRFSNGTTQATAAGGSGFTPSASSRTLNLPITTWTNTSPGPCTDGSTVTMTMASSSGRATLIFTGTFFQSSGINSIVRLSVLRDGVNISGTNGYMVLAAGPVANYLMNASFAFLDDGISAGSHSWCIAPSVDSFTGGYGTSTNSFAVLEVQ